MAPPVTRAPAHAGRPAATEFVDRADQGDHHEQTDHQLPKRQEEAEARVFGEDAAAGVWHACNSGTLTRASEATDPDLPFRGSST